MNPQPEPNGQGGYWVSCDAVQSMIHLPDSMGVLSVENPYGKRGDRLWVKESFQVRYYETLKSPVIWYPNDGEISLAPTLGMLRHGVDSSVIEKYVKDHVNKKLVISRWMPRWVSRITLEIVEVTVERVNSISADDCLAEGILVNCSACSGECGHWDTNPDLHKRAKKEYRELWDTINKKRGFGWDKNPFVWVIKFKTVKS